jgi:hypothetical protein
LKNQEKDESNQVGIDIHCSDNPGPLSALPVFDVFDFGADELLFPATDDRHSIMNLKDPQLFREKVRVAGPWADAEDDSSLGGESG